MGLDEKRASACWAGILSQLDTTRVTEDDQTYSASIAGGDAIGQLQIVRTLDAETGCTIVLQKGAQYWHLSQGGEHDVARAAQVVTHLILEGSGGARPTTRLPRPGSTKPGDDPDPWGDPWIQGPPVRIVDIKSLTPLKRI